MNGLEAIVVDLVDVFEYHGGHAAGMITRADTSVIWTWPATADSVAPTVNQMKTRLQALGPARPGDPRDVRRRARAAAVEALDDDHREALERRRREARPRPTAIRAAATKGRINGAMESIALVLTDAALADCIEKLGDHADNPTSEQLAEVLPGVVERHGLAITRMMLASTVAGEAAAGDRHPRPAQARRPRQAAAGGAAPDRPGRRPPRTTPDPEREALKAKRARGPPAQAGGGGAAPRAVRPRPRPRLTLAA